MTGKLQASVLSLYVRVVQATRDCARVRNQIEIRAGMIVNFARESSERNQSDARAPALIPLRSYEGSLDLFADDQREEDRFDEDAVI